MNPTTNRQKAHPRERGSILVFTGIALLTLVGMTVIGVDLGRLAFTATEVQTVAEVAATGYAHAWMKGAITAGGDPGDGACRAGANAVVDGNRIDAKIATAQNIESYERGFWDYDTGGPFTTAVPGGESANAVRATGTATVTNFFAALFGTPASTVRKTAVATLTCGTRARPFPLIVQDCSFGGFDGPEDCADLPTLTQQNVHEENSCFTSLSSSSASSGRIGELIAGACCPGGPGSCELPADYPKVSQDQDIRVINGQSSMLKAMQTCWDNGYRDFLVPITPCGTACNQSNVISGFAYITLTERPTATGSTKYVALNSFCNAGDELEGGGGNCYGAYKTAMVE